MTARLVEIPGCAPRSGSDYRTVVALGSMRIALFEVDGAIRAVEDACARCAWPLSEGAVVHGRVSCPGCGWRYDLASGRSEQVPEIGLHTFNIRVEASRVLIEWSGPGE